MLVVNDYAPDRQYLCTLFRYQGFSVLEAADAPAAVAIAERHPIDVVVSGARVPPVGGFEFVRRLRVACGANLPIVFYTNGQFEREARAVAELCGVHDILTRTSSPEMIVDRVHALAARARQGGARPATVEPTSLPPAEGPGRPSLQLFDMVQELAAAEQQLTAVATIAQQLTRERAEPALLPSVVDALRSITGAEYAVGGLLDASGAEVQGRTAGGGEAAGRAALEQAALSETFRASMAQRAPLRWDATGRTVDIFTHGVPGLVIAGGLAVPLATPTRVYGWVAALNRVRGTGFSDRDEQAARILGSQAGCAYENAGLISEFRQQTGRLQTEAAHTTFALEAARTGVWTWDLAGRGWHGSESLRSVLGLPGSDGAFQLDDLLALVPEDDRPRVEQGFLRSAADLSGVAVEFTIERPDGHVRILQASGRVSVDGAGRAGRMHGVLVDITDRRLLEAQLRQAQRIETVGLLAGGIAHDFNNMLTAILGYARLAEDAVLHNASPLNEVQQITKAAERASLLTRQLLAFSRQQMLEPIRLDLNALLDDLTGMLRRLIGDHIQVAVRLDAAQPFILGDRSQIEQVIMNLVVNARDAMPEGGRIDIATGLVHFGAADRIRGAAVLPGRYVVLSVGDSGSGIPEHLMGRIFDPFFTTKERGRGTGLGLATVYGVLRQCGGYVDVVSESGRGTTFFAYFPALDGAAAPAVAAPVTRSRSGSERVLVVEDEPEVRRLVKTVLERAGYRVADAADAREAERILAASDGAFDLLIADIVMPGGTGADLYQRLARVRPSMRVVFMSGYADDQAVAEAAAQPGTIFLQKPFTLETLLRRVREALDR